MPLVKFLETKILRSGTPTEVIFEKGKVYDLPQTSVDRWKKRSAVTTPTEEEVKAFYGTKRQARPVTATSPSSQTTPPKPAQPKPAAPESKAADPKETDDAKAPAPVSAKPADDTKTDTVVEIPKGFADLGWPQLKALAQQISGGTVNSRADAVKVIEEELAKRQPK